MQTADCRPGGKMQSEFKMQTADFRPGGKMQTEGKMQTADRGVKRRLRVKCTL